MDSLGLGMTEPVESMEALDTQIYVMTPPDGVPSPGGMNNHGPMEHDDDAMDAMGDDPNHDDPNENTPMEPGAAPVETPKGEEQEAASQPQPKEDHEVLKPSKHSHRREKKEKKSKKTKATTKQEQTAGSQKEDEAKENKDPNKGKRRPKDEVERKLHSVTCLHAYMAVLLMHVFNVLEPICKHAPICMMVILYSCQSGLLQCIEVFQRPGICAGSVQAAGCGSSFGAACPNLLHVLFQDVYCEIYLGFPFMEPRWAKKEGPQDHPAIIKLLKDA